MALLAPAAHRADAVVGRGPVRGRVATVPVRPVVRRGVERVLLPDEVRPISHRGAPAVRPVPDRDVLDHGPAYREPARPVPQVRSHGSRVPVCEAGGKGVEVAGVSPAADPAARDRRHARVRGRPVRYDVPEVPLRRVVRRGPIRVRLVHVVDRVPHPRAESPSGGPDHDAIDVRHGDPEGARVVDEGHPAVSDVVRDPRGRDPVPYRANARRGPPGRVELDHVAPGLARVRVRGPVRDDVREPSEGVVVGRCPEGVRVREEVVPGGDPRSRPARGVHDPDRVDADDRELARRVREDRADRR